MERSFLANLEWPLYDIRTSYFSAPVQTHPDIIIVALDEATLDALPHQVPVERRFLAALVTAIRRGEPAALGLDILLDRPTVPEADGHLAAALARPGPPVVIAVPLGDVPSGKGEGNDARGQNRDPWHSMLGQTVRHGEPRLFAGLSDRVVRRWRRADDPGDSWGAGVPLAAALADAARPGDGPRPAPNSGQLIPFALDKADHWPFAIISALDLLTMAQAGKVAWLKDKIVLVGKITPGDDRHATPLRYMRPVDSAGRGAPGVVIHAYKLAQALDGTRVARPGFWGLSLIAVLLALGGLVLGLGVLRPLWLAIAIVSGIAGFAVLATGLYAFWGLMIPILAPSLAFACATFITAAIGRRDARERAAWLADSFALYLAPAVVERLVEDPESLCLSGESRQISVLFTDLEGFTAFIERHPPEDALRLLNAYFDDVLAVAFRHEGTVDKIVGDALHLMFNAPADQPDHAARAVACALEIAAVTRTFQEALPEQFADFGRTRIGVHSGPAMVGNFGNRQRFDYTAHGTTVNLASRLEALNKELGTTICVSDAVRQAAPGFDYKDLGPRKIRSLSEPVHVWEPIGRKGRDIHSAVFP